MERLDQDSEIPDSGFFQVMPPCLSIGSFCLSPFTEWLWAQTNLGFGVTPAFMSYFSCSVQWSCEVGRMLISLLSDSTMKIWQSKWSEKGWHETPVQPGLGLLVKSTWHKIDQGALKTIHRGLELNVVLERQDSRERRNRWRSTPANDLTFTTWELQHLGLVPSAL